MKAYLLVASTRRAPSLRASRPTSIAVKARRKDRDFSNAQILIDEFRQNALASSTLRTNPTDENANTTAGLYLLLAQGKVKEGVKLLELSKDPSLQQIVRLETFKASSLAIKLTWPKHGSPSPVGPFRPQVCAFVPLSARGIGVNKA
jgi:hypothetical protein